MAPMAWSSSKGEANLIAVSIHFEYDPDELATKITTQLVHKRNSKNLCVVIFVGQIVFNLSTTQDEIKGLRLIQGLQRDARGRCFWGLGLPLTGLCFGVPRRVWVWALGLSAEFGRWV